MVVCVSTLSGCDRFSTFDRLGVSADGEDLTIHYLACEFERLAAVRLYAGNSPDEGEDNELLWEIRSENGDGGGEFVVGSVPGGFKETVAFEGSLPADGYLIAAVELEDSVGAALDFHMADLEPGRIRNPDKPDVNLTPIDFVAQAQASCRPSS